MIWESLSANDRCSLSAISGTASSDSPRSARCSAGGLIPTTPHALGLSRPPTWDQYYVDQGRPEALPEAVCAVLEAHPDAQPRWARGCVICSFETPTVRLRPTLTVCLLCGDIVRWQGFNGRRWCVLR